MDASNLFAGIPHDLPQEWCETLAQSSHVTIERIVSRGHRSPPGFWYDQDRHEWVVLLKGEATLAFDDPPQLLKLTPGMHVNIAAHRRHRVEATSATEDTVWLVVFYD